MMASHPLVEKYLEIMEEELNDLDRERRKSIISDVRDHIDERVRDVSGDPDKVGSDVVQKVLWDFGPPDEIAEYYRMQSLGERPERKKGKRNQIIITVLSVIIVAILVSAGLFILLQDDNKPPGTEIIPGKGNERVEIGNSMEDVLEEYGEPEERIDSANTIWFSYRDLRGIDILISNDTGSVMEIRFNEGYTGKLASDIGVGSNISLLFEKEGGPEMEYDVREWLVRYHPGGYDRVLYRVFNESGNHISNKYMDGRTGILYWMTPEGEITQITVFEPIPENTVQVLMVDIWIDPEEDIVSILALSSDLNWTWYEIRVDGKVFWTSANYSRAGETASFHDSAGEWDAEVGKEYNVKIILIGDKTVVYEDDIIVTAL
jgi:hypothetical protein